MSSPQLRPDPAKLVTMPAFQCYQAGFQLARIEYALASGKSFGRFIYPVNAQAVIKMCNEAGRSFTLTEGIHWDAAQPLYLSVPAERPLAASKCVDHDDRPQATRSSETAVRELVEIAEIDPLTGEEATPRPAMIYRQSPQP